MSAFAFSRTAFDQPSRPLRELMDSILNSLARLSRVWQNGSITTNVRPFTADEMLESIRAERNLLDLQEYEEAIVRAEAAKEPAAVARLRARYQKRFRIAFDCHAEFVETLQAIRDTACMPVDVAHLGAYRLFDRKGLTSPAPGDGSA